MELDMALVIFSNVHEGPHSISKNNKIPLKNGLILSNEPDIIKKIILVLE